MILKETMRRLFRAAMKNPKTRRMLRAVMQRGQRVVDWLRNKLIYAQDARAFNRVFFEDVTQFDGSDVEAVQAKIRALCLARGYDAETVEIWVNHVYRLLHTEQWIAEALAELPKSPGALDLGAPGVASDYWRFKFPDVRWENTDYDLRFPWKAPVSSCDFILCTELVEHLSDQPNEIFNEGFYKSGFASMLREAFHALKPGGYMLITTPNAASVLHLKAVLQGTPPWFFIKHVREYTLSEIIELLEKAGFETARKRDIHCMSAAAGFDYSPLFQLLLENGFPVEGRGDDLFVLARKPNKTTGKAQGE